MYNHVTRLQVRVTSTPAMRAERSVMTMPRVSVHAVKKMLSLQLGAGA